MAKPTKEQISQKYCDWIRMGEQFLKHYSTDWDRWESYWDTPHVATSYKDSIMDDAGKGFKLPYNIVWLNWKNLTSILSGGEPIPIITPMEKDKDRSARLLEALEIYYFRIKNFKQELKMCIQDVLTYNLAYFKQGYYLEFSDAVGKEGPDATLRKLSLAGEQDEEKIDKKMLGSIENSDDSAELMLEEIPDTETWYGERVDPKMVLVPPNAKYDLNKSPWIIHKLIKTTYEATSQFTGLQDMIPTSVQNFGSEDEPLDVPVFEIYEIWDKTDLANKKVVYVVADSSELGEDKQTSYKELEVIDWPEGLTGFPISRLTLNFSPRKFYLPPDVFMYEHMAQALSELLSTQMGAQRRNRRRYGYKPNEISPEDLEAIAYGPDGIYFSASNQESVWEMQQSAPNLDYGFYNLLQRTIGECSGVDEFNRGSSSRTETATEASFVKAGSRTRVDDMIAGLYVFLDDVMSKMGTIIQKNMSGEKMVKIDPDLMLALGEESPWVNVSSEDIDGLFSYKVKAGSVARETSEEKKRHYFEFFNLAAQDPYFDPILVRKALLENWLEVPGAEDFLKANAAGQTEQAIMLEHTLASVGQPIPQPSPEEDLEAHAQAHQEFLNNPPEEIRAQMAQTQNQAEVDKLKAEQGSPVEETEDIAQTEQVGNVLGKWEQIQQIVEEHLELTRQIMSGGSGAGPVDHNTNAAAMAESPETPRRPETSVALGDIQQ